ncbi:hypothetical protein V1509DRAFT_633830, partial [Lipomyces kononenkoae]
MVVTFTYRSGETDRPINPCQKGLLMGSRIHNQFDSFRCSIDPDDDYKKTCFRVDMNGIDRRFLDLVCRLLCGCTMTLVTPPTC